MEQEEIEKIKKAGEIHAKVIAYAREIVKPGMKLLEIAEKIDNKITELGKVEIVGKSAEFVGPAFPVNLSVNEQAAHCTPGFNDEGVAFGLLKVDIGVHVDGFVADGAFSLDLDETGSEKSEENRKLIEAVEAGLNSGLEKIEVGVSLREVGKVIGDKITSFGFKPVKNLTGHEIGQYNLHAGLNVPNYDNEDEIILKEGLYAMEPFSTNGEGRVKNGRPSGIYRFQESQERLIVRDNFAREVLRFLFEEYRGLPFCARWIHKKFGTRGLLALKNLENSGVIYQYPQLVEAVGGKVAQAEHTVLLTKEGKIVTTK